MSRTGPEMPGPSPGSRAYRDHCGARLLVAIAIGAHLLVAIGEPVLGVSMAVKPRLTAVNPSLTAVNPSLTAVNPYSLTPLFSNLFSIFFLMLFLVFYLFYTSLLLPIHFFLLK